MNWMKYRLLYFLISAIFIGAGVFGVIKWGLNQGIDFKGGSIIEYKFGGKVSTEEATKKIEEVGIAVGSVQQTSGDTYLFKLSSVSIEEKGKIVSSLKTVDESIEEVRFENVGPSIGPELIRKTIYALAIALFAILSWVAIQFRSIKFGISAILATLHDSVILVGSFSLLGHFFGAEIDYLFVTALLTTLSFSVHDTIVVYDRIREAQKKVGGSLYQLANKAVTETMVRSLNNSFTIIFMLVALILLGGSTIRWFSIALLIGTVSGTYSSPFVAVPILVAWDEIEKRVRR